MSRSWARSRRQREGRALVQPVPALIAAAVVCVAVSLYATALHDRTPGADRDLAGPAADEAVDALTDTGVADPARLGNASEHAPPGYEANLTLTAHDRAWTAGPTPPDDASTATRSVTVRVGPGRHRPGRIRVVVWT